VQGVLEEAIAAVAREPVDVLGASRTDAGVHALGQVASFRCGLDLAPPRLRAAINARLPDDVQVRGVEVVAEDFDPIGGAVAKSYRYRMAWGRGRPGRAPRPLFSRATTWWTPFELDPVLMNEAARRLIGTHDFASFTRKDHGRESTLRTIFDCRVTAGPGRTARIDVTGNGFLYNMVRIIAGTLAEIGRGRLDPARVETMLAAADRRAAGPTLGPEGLFLMWVSY
jgi:tRNA pseudouridine38-40 synthase